MKPMGDPRADRNPPAVMLWYSRLRTLKIGLNQRSLKPRLKTITDMTTDTPSVLVSRSRQIVIQQLAGHKTIQMSARDRPDERSICSPRESLFMLPSVDSDHFRNRPPGLIESPGHGSVVFDIHSGRRAPLSESSRMGSRVSPTSFPHSQTLICLRAVVSKSPFFVRLPNRLAHRAAIRSRIQTPRVEYDTSELFGIRHLDVFRR